MKFFLALLREGMFADIAVFDPGKVIDRVTFDRRINIRQELNTYW